jgi:hypothetical protein
MTHEEAGITRKGKVGLPGGGWSTRVHYRKVR